MNLSLYFKAQGTKHERQSNDQHIYGCAEKTHPNKFKNYLLNNLFTVQYKHSDVQDVDATETSTVGDH